MLLSDTTISCTHTRPKYRGIKSIPRVIIELLYLNYRFIVLKRFVFIHTVNICNKSFVLFSVLDDLENKGVEGAFIVILSSNHYNIRENG